uniref:CSD domain-containing protein n=1 Tax=Strongyloides stercoralis TaxID=6248 RepID=A0A0K0ED40_STRER
MVVKFNIYYILYSFLQFVLATFRFFFLYFYRYNLVMVFDNNIATDTDSTNADISNKNFDVNNSSNIKVEEDSKVDYVKASLNEGNNDDSANEKEASVENNGKILERGITGIVRWFNVKMGYGFIKRNDTDNDIFVYYKSISKKNPNKRLRSLATDEEVVFDVIDGRRGNEAGNVTGPNGEPVKGSHIDSRFKKNSKKFPYFRKKFNMPNKERDPNQKILEENVYGEIIFFNFRRGFGFIKREDNGESVFCHILDIIKKNPRKFRYLAFGSSVRFDIVKGLKGYEAAYVTNKDGTPISGIKKRKRRQNNVIPSTDSEKKNEKEMILKKKNKRSRRSRRGRNGKKEIEEQTNETQNLSKKGDMSSVVSNDNGEVSNNNVSVGDKVPQQRSDISLVSEAFENLNL